MYKLVLFLFLVLGGCGIEYDLQPVSGPGSTPSIEANALYDILIVLDTSCSMRDNVYVDYGITQLPSELNDAEANWQMAITTADPIVEDWFEIDSTLQDPGWSIIEGLQLVRGNYLTQGEAGTDAAHRFIESNPGWLRPGATTLLLIISDETNQSDRDLSELDNWPTPLHTTTMVGLEHSSCADPAPNYWAVSNQVIDICANEPWSILQ